MANLKVHISPGLDQVKDNNGVGRVIHAQYKYLPALGIDLVDSPDGADVIACHIQQGDLPRVDVLHTHGLYWSGDPHSGQYTNTHHEANSRILEAARRAQVITVPSEWVAMPFKRDMRLSPTVIGHGIDMAALPKRAPHKGYVLWNKNRDSDVCSPAAANALAARGVPMVATYGQAGPHMQLVGSLAHADMMDVLRHAEVYLATTKETFGIGTLEALALGVPVLGYAWGGTADLVTPDCGVLVAPGDIDGLMAGLARIRANHAAMAAACVVRARQYDWPRVMERYVDCYREAHMRRTLEQHRVAVVITNYNYAAHVGGAIESAVMQTHEVHKIIVVDDGSTDNSVAEIERIIAGIEADFPALPITLIQQANQGVAAARNTGIAAATSEYIICLDADDELAPGYVKACRAALMADRGLGVAYTGLAWLQDEGPIGPNIWKAEFDWALQTTPSNPPATTIHCAAMFRRAMWERAGGYQQIYAPGEDTEFFTRGLSVGYTAKRVTDEPLFLYRNTTGSASKTKAYRPIDTWHPWMRDKLYPMAAPAAKQPPVRSYSEPLISVVIPVGPGHAEKLPAALDSLLGQTFRGWEVICVLDYHIDEHDPALAALERYSFVRWDDDMVHVGGGAGQNRNIGLEMARAPLVLFLDADDYLIPTALQAMLDAYRQGQAGYVYSDWYGRDSAGKMDVHVSRDYDQRDWARGIFPAVTVLMATEDARAVGGFDEAMRGWEECDFFIKCAVHGICGRRVPEPLLVYNFDTGTVRKASHANKDALLATLRARYGDYETGGKQMTPCCGGNGAALMAIKQHLEGAPVVAEAITPTDANVVRMEYIGERVAPVQFAGPVSRQIYRGGNNQYDKYHDVAPGDVAHLVGTGEWRVIPGQRPIPHVTPVAELIAPAPEPEAPLSPPEPDDLTPEQEAAANRAAAALVKAQRKAARA